MSDLCSALEERCRSDEDIPRQFFRWAARNPEGIALSWSGGSVRWRRLAREARSIASAVTRNAPDGASPVALLATSGPERVAAMLGVLAAGRMLVPLDPAAPPGHLATLLKGAGARVLLTTRDSRDAAERVATRATLCLAVEDAIAAGDLGEPRRSTHADETACLLYTSGSTGAPKGVLHSHRSLMANAQSRVLGYDLTAEDRLAALYSPSSGGALATLLSAWLAGGSVHLLDERDGVHRLRDRLRESGVTVLALIVSSFREMARTRGGADSSIGECVDGVRLLSLSGETLHEGDITEARRVFGRSCTVVNSYATTETGTVCRAVGVQSRSADVGDVALGSPADGVGVVLLDDDDVPISGAGVGQIAVRGPALSTGYWRRPELEELAFRGDGTERLYLTGDSGRLDASGTLWHLGRRDGAVNIDGRLVDVGSVERALAALPGVLEAAVVAVRDRRASVRLIAHVTLAPGCEHTPADMRARLAESGPAAALPASIRIHAALPRLVGGKVDRRQLARGDTQDESGAHSVTHAGAQPGVEPHTEVQLRLAALFASALGVPAVGLRDDFFDLGGHSLLAVSLLKSVEESFHRTLTLADLMAAPDVERFAGRLDAGEAPLRQSHCLLLTEGSGGVPVFCVCGLMLYRALADHLGGDHPVYAVYVQAEIDLLRDDANGRAARRTLTIEELASAYIREMRSVRPSGPYHVVGESFGGLVAFEVAHQLRNAGEEVGLVGLLDTMPPGYSGNGLMGRLRHRVRRVRRVLRERLSGDRSRSNPDEDLHGLSVAARRVEARLDRIRQRLYRSALRRYRLAAYSGRLALFRARDTVSSFTRREETVALWSQVAHGDFDCHDVPGTHIGILKPPHVVSLARALRKSLDLAEQR